ALLLKALSPFLSLFLAITAAFASLPFAQARLKSFSLAALLLSYALVAAWVYAGELKKLTGKIKQVFQGKSVLALIFCFLLVLACCFQATRSRMLEVTFLDVGQGAALFIRTPAGSSLLIDAGGASFERARDPGESVLVPFLNYRQTKKLNALFITHPHADHYGGAFSLLDSFRTDMLGVSVLTGEDGYRDLLAEARRRGITLLTLAAGDRVRPDRDVELQVLHPTTRLEKDTEAAENNNSLVMRLVYGDIGFLFTGDIEGESEAFLVQSGRDLKCTVLQIPHHGSAASTGEAFLAQANPQYAVIPVGPNPFGHPSEEVLKRLENRGIAVYRTDLHGAVTFKTDGKKLTVSSMLK
ncbi:MAG TPA: MBL fold metallo-hydrolase, partial [Firmicutes bacterium]|nr:MBL fold metallo-hydrolase [Bacillota bacterium]